MKIKNVSGMVLIIGRFRVLPHGVLPAVPLTSYEKKSIEQYSKLGYLADIQPAKAVTEPAKPEPVQPKPMQPAEDAIVPEVPAEPEPEPVKEEVPAEEVPVEEVEEVQPSEEAQPSRRSRRRR